MTYAASPRREWVRRIRRSDSPAGPRTTAPTTPGSAANSQGGGEQHSGARPRALAERPLRDRSHGLGGHVHFDSVRDAVTEVRPHEVGGVAPVKRFRTSPRGASQRCQSQLLSRSTPPHRGRTASRLEVGARRQPGGTPSSNRRLRAFRQRMRACRR